MAGFTFRDTERLKKKKLIDQLFAKGLSFYHYPYKVVWLFSPNEQPLPAQMMVSVSRRMMKRAVDRNRVKRQVRELYRLEKGAVYEFLQEKHKFALIAIIFTGNELLDFPVAREKINQAMARLIKEMKKHSDR